MNHHWIKISENSLMPVNKECVLVIEKPLYMNFTNAAVALYVYDKEEHPEHKHSFYINGRTARVTHWTPLPELPKD